MSGSPSCGEHKLMFWFQRESSHLQKNITRLSAPCLGLVGRSTSVDRDPRSGRTHQMPRSIRIGSGGPGNGHIPAFSKNRRPRERAAAALAQRRRCAQLQEVSDVVKLGTKLPPIELASGNGETSRKSSANLLPKRQWRLSSPRNRVLRRKLACHVNAIFCCVTGTDSLAHLCLGHKVAPCMPDALGILWAPTAGAVLVGATGS